MLHPFRMANVERQTFKNQMVAVDAFYNFENLIEESETWYDVWKNRCQNKLPKETLEKMALYESTEFYCCGTVVVELNVKNLIST